MSSVIASPGRMSLPEHRINAVEIDIIHKSFIAVLQAWCMDLGNGGVCQPVLHPLAIWDPLGDIKELISA